MTYELKALEHENLSSVVYATLCDAIIKGRFQSGDRLKIREVAEKLGTSVTPVRDAIIRLAHDGALVFQSARDIRIPTLTLERYLEIRAIRLRLEALAAENAARLASEADAHKLLHILEANEKAIADGNRLRSRELNQAFHFQIAVMAGMPLLHDTLRRIWLQMGPLIADTYDASGRAMIDHHYPVVKAIGRNDPDAAAAAIMKDITLAGQAILDRIQRIS